MYMRAKVVALCLALLMFGIPGALAGGPSDENDGATVSPRAGGTPPWATFHGDIAHTGNSSDPAPGTNQTLWITDIGAYSYGSPAVAGGKVYMPSNNGSLTCLNADTGAKIWVVANVTSSYMDAPWCTPAVDVANDRVYITDANQLFAAYGVVQTPEIICLNASTGALVWKNALPAMGESSPLLYNGNLYVTSGDPVQGTEATTLYCLNPATGATNWTVPSVGSVSSPLIYNNMLITYSGSALKALNPASSGSQLWSTTLTAGGGNYDFGSPAAADGNIYMCTGKTGHVFCIQASNGAKLWEKAPGYSALYSTPAISNGSVYIVASADWFGQPTGGALIKMDGADGSTKWTYSVPANQGTPWDSAAVSGEFVYFGAGATIYCIKTDGTLRWSYKGAWNTGQNAYGIGSSPAIANGNLYIGGADSKLYCFQQGPPNQAPAAVVLQAPNTIRETSMMLGWSPNNDADFAAYEVHKGTTAGFIPSPLTKITNITAKATTTYNASSLNYSTKYYFKVRVWDSGFPPMFNDSNEVGETTLTPNGAPAAVVLNQPSEITPYTMKLIWSTNNDPDFTKYEVYKGTSTGFQLLPSGLVGTFTARDQTTSVVQNLVPWTQYYFKVKVYDNGTPALSSVSNEVGTLSGNTPPVAVTLNPAQMAATSAYLTWSASPDEDFAFYEVHMSRNASFALGVSTVVTNLTNKATTEFTVENLALAKNYYFAIRVCDIGGLHNDSNYVNGTTANTIPKPVISSPSEGDIFDTRTNITFNGTGTSDQDMDELTFYWASSLDGGLSSKASFTRTLSEGEHKITLWANDGNGHNASAKVTITVKKAPDRAPGLLLLSHKENDEVAGLVKFTGTAWDIDGNATLTAVQVKDQKGDWKPITGTLTWTYDWNVSKLPNGKQKVSFRSFDGELYSPEVSVTLKINNINVPPVVSITTSASTAFTKVVTITGTASDPDGTVTKVELSLNGGAWVAVTGTNSWSYPLDTAVLKNGAHSLQVRAYDGQNYSDAITMNFNVKNTKAPVNVNNGPSTMLLAVIGVIIAVAVVAGIMMMRRKKVSPAAAPPQVAPPPQAQMAPQPAPAYPPAPQEPQQYQQPAQQYDQSQPPQQDGYQQQPQENYQQQPQENYQQQP